MPVEVVAERCARRRRHRAVEPKQVPSPEDRVRARSLHRALFAMQEACREGERDAEALLARGREVVDCDRLDYLDIRDAETLEPVARVERPARALIAAVVGRPRLLDNVGLEPE